MIELTIQYLIQNKRKTLLTVLATSLSVTMLTAIIVAATSGYEFLKRDTELTYGNYHVLYYDVPLNEIEHIKSHESTDEIMTNYQVGYATTSLATKKSPSYLYVEAHDFTKKAYRPINELEGRLPQNSTELVVTRSYLNSLSKKLELGDELSVMHGIRYAKDESIKRELGQRDYSKEEFFESSYPHTYTIVGIIDDFSTSGVGSLVLTQVDEAVLDKMSAVDVATLMHPGYSYSDVILEIGEAAQLPIIDENPFFEAGKYNVDVNLSLLRYIGGFSQAELGEVILKFSLLLIAVVMVVSIQIIHNAFDLSLATRRKNMGILSSVGATKRQKSQMIFIEAFLIGIISIPIGLLAAMIGLYLTFTVITDILSKLTTYQFHTDLTVVFLPVHLILVSILAALTVYLSAFRSAKSAGKVSAIECIKQVPDYTKIKKPIRVSKTITSLFGFEGELAVKTMKRKKRQFYTTVIGLAFSLGIFLVVCHVLTLSDQMTTFFIGKEAYHSRIYLHNYYEESAEEFESYIAAVDNLSTDDHILVNYSLLGKRINFTSDLNEKMHPAFMNQHIYVEINALNDQQFSEFLKQNNLEQDMEAVVLENMFMVYEEDKYEIYPIFEEADTLTFDVNFDMYSEDTNEFEDINVPLEITQQLKIAPKEVNGNELKVFVTKHHLESILAPHLEIQNLSYSLDLSISGGDAIAFDEAYQTLNHPLKESARYYNNEMNAQQEDLIRLIIEIFSIGFLVLILILTLLSVFNNISNNIIFRKKELSALISVGMTEQSLQKMIRLESSLYLFYACLYGLPITILIMLGFTRTIRDIYPISYLTLPYHAIIFIIILLIIFTKLTTTYSLSQFKKMSIVDNLRYENI